MIIIAEIRTLSRIFEGWGLSYPVGNLSTWGLHLQGRGNRREALRPPHHEERGGCHRPGADRVHREGETQEGPMP